MSPGLAFWVLMFIWLAVGAWRAWPNLPASGGDVILFALLALLGWHDFGSPIK